MDCLQINPEPRAASCDEHGEYQSRNVIGSIWSQCPTCGRLAEERNRQKLDAERQAADRAQWEARLAASGIPPRFQDRTLQTYVAETEPQRRALQFAMAYADGFEEIMKTGRSAFLTGKPGTGKTHLAIGIGMSLMRRQQRSVLFTTAMRAIRRVKNTWNKGATETEAAAISAMAKPDLLILDEIGVQFGSDAEKLILFDILNERYETRLPTLMCTNLTTREIGSMIGDRIYDRIREDGGEAVVFDWESYRGRAA